jgi:general stress protein YciG
LIYFHRTHSGGNNVKLREIILCLHACKRFSDRVNYRLEQVAFKFFSYKRRLKMRENKSTHTGDGNSNRGFASMPHEQVEEIAHKGGEASAQKAGHEGMAERGRKGGEASAQKAGHEGMAERGRKGGEASGNSRSGNAED